jgi:hypothetical protein
MKGGKGLEPDRIQVTIWRMRIAYWIPKAINILSEYVTLIAFALQQWLHQRASMLCYTYTAFLILTAIIQIFTLCIK